MPKAAMENLMTIQIPIQMDGEVTETLMFCIQNTLSIFLNCDRVYATYNLYIGDYDETFIDTFFVDCRSLR